MARERDKTEARLANGMSHHSLSQPQVQSDFPSWKLSLNLGQSSHQWFQAMDFFNCFLKSSLCFWLP